MSSGFIDGHAHLRDSAEGREALLASMDASGIAQAIVVAGGTIDPVHLSRQILRGGGIDVTPDNQSILRECRLSQGRLLPYFFANPIHGDELYRREGKDFHGLKLAPAVHGVPLLDERHLRLVETATGFSHPVYLHCLPRQGFGVSDLVALSQRFPTTKFILGHAGVGNCDFYGVSLIAPYPQISLETSGGFSAVIRFAIAELGAERVMFGSEYPLQNPKLEIEKLRSLNLSSITWDRVIRENALNLVTGGSHA